MQWHSLSNLFRVAKFSAALDFKKCLKVGCHRDACLLALPLRRQRQTGESLSSSVFQERKGYTEKSYLEKNKKTKCLKVF